MSEISMIGLGAMGSALARALLKSGHGLTVWNRTPQKMEPLAALGAKSAESVADAVQASPLIMVCIDNYAATNQLLSSDDVVPHLAGRTVIQLGTGTPKEARDTETWLQDCGADYLDGAIDSYPDGIGAADGRILFSGSKAAFARSEAFLKCLGGDLRYLGENVGAAAALDLAELSESLGKYVGLVHGARLCEAEGVGADLLASLYPVGNRARELAEIIHAGDFSLGSLYDGATIRVWEEVVQRLQTQARDAGMNGDLPDYLSRLFKRAVAAGHGEKDIAALIKVLRGSGEA
jgi:3-hydroxyisobutyrate dehydrogenase-like beta-hydroxyacid dehydrogenase